MNTLIENAGKKNYLHDFVVIFYNVTAEILFILYLYFEFIILHNDN